MSMASHAQSIQSNFAKSLQHLKKEVRSDVNFLHADKHQSFQQVDIFFDVFSQAFPKYLIWSCIPKELESDLRITVDYGKKWLVDFNAGKTQLVLFDRSNNAGAIDVKVDGSALEEKSFFKMLGLCFSSKLDWGCYIISIVKTASKIICYLNFLSREVAHYLYKSTLQPCMEFCCHVWGGTPSCYLENIR